ncbi:MAG TPA: ATP-binding cassette domain-containing protein [Nitrososphaerales archaeon]|nr:ATP-binding cassette domain-containing protein [Nitrososphaerales archaeon]
MVKSSPVISLSDVSLVLDSKRVLNHVDWTVMPGENWVVIGPNGAGKTSLLSIINGYRWPSSGNIAVLGRRFGEADLRELRVLTGLVSSYLDWMLGGDEKVLEVVMSGKFGSTRVWRRVSERDVRRASSLLKSLGCVQLRSKTLSEVSQGERQKVAIARAMMAGPRLMVLDEPCEGLDIASRESFLEGLERLMAEKEHPTFIEVTHRTEDVPPGFTHALLLRDGSVVASGEIAKALTSANLTRCLGVDVELRRLGGRHYMVPR